MANGSLRPNLSTVTLAAWLSGAGEVLGIRTTARKFLCKQIQGGGSMSSPWQSLHHCLVWLLFLYSWHTLTLPDRAGEGGLHALTFNQAAANASIQYRPNAYIWEAKISSHNEQWGVQPRWHDGEVTLMPRSCGSTLPQGKGCTPRSKYRRTPAGPWLPLSLHHEMLLVRPPEVAGPDFSLCVV